MAVEESDQERDDRNDGPRYLTVTIEMVDSIAFEQVLESAEIADCHDYQSRFLRAAEDASSQGAEDARIVYEALAAVCGFHYRPNDVNDPYGPMVQMDGRRSAIPEDFRPTRDAVARMAEIATDTTLKARLSDVAWLLNRRRVDLGLAAIFSYCQTIREVAAETRKFRFEGSNSPYSAQARDLLKRALSLAAMRTVGLGKPEAAEARQLAADLFQGALTGNDIRNVQRMAKLALQYDVLPAADVGHLTEDWLQRNGAADDHDRIDILRLTASAYREAGSMQDHYRCRIDAAETQVRMADRMAGNSAMMAAGLLADAISELHGIPDVKEKRRELRHRLVDVQINISEEMGSFSHEINLADIVGDREASFEGLPLRDMLLVSRICRGRHHQMGFAPRR